jgi:hypothetical protein
MFLLPFRLGPDLCSQVPSGPDGKGLGSRRAASTCEPSVWNYIDVYPSISMRGWDVVTDRSEPGLSGFGNVSRTGFRCSVGEWAPVGISLTAVRIRVTSAPLYRPNEGQTTRVIRVRDREVL